MARIPDEVLERIKQDVSVLRLAESMGISFKKNGVDNFMCLCPWHDDKTPSLVISVRKNVFHCLGCGAKGSPVDWVMRQYGVSFRHAAELLQEGLPTDGSTPAGAARSSRVRHLPPPIDVEADDREALRQVVDYYHETLKGSPEALAYLEQRGLGSSEVIDHFRLGYANRTLGYRLPQKTRKLGDELRSRLQELGIYRETGHEHFNGSLVVPVFGEDGEVTELYGRKITPALRKGTPLHLYLPGPHRGIWNLDALKASTEIILCEALLDALTFWCHGYRNVTSSYGVNGFTDEHLEAFRRHGIERVLIAYDRDDAGNSAATALSEKLIAEGIECYRVEVPRGMDVNDYALKVTPAAKSLGLVLRKASWLGKGKPPATKPLVDRVCADAASLISLAAKEPLLAAKEESSSARETAPAAEPLASPLPPAPVASPSYECNGDELLVELGERRYRVRGVPKTPVGARLQVLVLLERSDEPELGSFADRLDLFVARGREAYAKQAAGELGVDADVVRRDLGVLLNRVEQYQDDEMKRKLEAEQRANVPALSDEEKAEALELLRAPDLLDRILVAFETCGVVGEQTNKLVGYLATVSRKLEKPLGVIIQSSSAAGKSSLMDAILAFVPKEEREKYSAVTGQSLFYADEMSLKHKVLAIVEEEGAERATYALKLLQSEGELTIASTGKDADTGKLTTRTYHVEGPVSILLTTTAVDIDEELLNRCLVLTVDEDREQTRAIHRLQRESLTLEGHRLRVRRERTLDVHRNAQRLLRPLRVVVPQAPELTFRDDRTRTRRDHMKYLALIQTITLLHQHQREVREDEQADFSYIEATTEDIAIANRLAGEVLGRSLDELAPQTRRLLMKLEEMVAEKCEAEKLRRTDYRFSRREVREHTGWGNTQLKVHLSRLMDFEYLALWRGGRGNAFEYELLYDGQGKDGERFFTGLLDVDSLTYDAERSGQNEGRSGSNEERSVAGRPLVGPWSAGCRGDISTETPLDESENPAATLELSENARLGSVPPKPRRKSVAAEASS